MLCDFNYSRYGRHLSAYGHYHEAVDFVAGNHNRKMSWITDLAGKAEHLLNKLDTEAATVLNNDRTNSSTAKSQLKFEGVSTTTASQYDR